MPLVSPGHTTETNQKQSASVRLITVMPRAFSGLCLLIRPFLLPIILLLPIATLAPFFSGPLFCDEGVFATIARGLLKGSLPYRDYFDIQPPATYVWYAIGFLFFGEHIWVPRLILALTLSATTFLIFTQAQLLYSRPAAFWASLAFGASTAFVRISIFANGYYFALLPVAAAYVAFTLAVQQSGKPWLFACGIFGGIALVTNQTSIVHFLVLLSLSQVFITSRPRIALVLMIMGASFVLGIVALPYLLTQSLGDLWYGAIKYPLLYSGGSSLADRFSYSLHQGIWFLLIAGPLVLLGSLGAVEVWRNSRRLSIFVTFGWLCASTLTLAMTGRFFPYYFVGLLPPLALLSGAGVNHSLTNKLNLHQVILICTFGGLLLVSLSLNGSMYSQPTGDGKLMAWGFTPEYQLRDAQSRLVAINLALKTGPHDTIYNLGRQGELYYYSKRMPASRFLDHWALYGDKANIQIALEDLERNKPTYIIDTEWPEYLEGLTPSYIWEIRAFIQEHYDLDSRVPFDDNLLQVYKNIPSGAHTVGNLTFYANIYHLKNSKEVQ